MLSFKVLCLNNQQLKPHHVSIKCHSYARVLRQVCNLEMILSKICLSKIMSSPSWNANRSFQRKLPMLIGGGTANSFYSTITHASTSKINSWMRLSIHRLLWTFLWPGNFKIFILFLASSNNCSLTFKTSAIPRSHLRALWQHHSTFSKGNAKPSWSNSQPWSYLRTIK